MLYYRECFSNFEKNDNGFELDSILTSSPAYILEIEKVRKSFIFFFFLFFSVLFP